MALQQSARKKKEPRLVDHTAGPKNALPPWMKAWTCTGAPVAMTDTRTMPQTLLARSPRVANLACLPGLPTMR